MKKKIIVASVFTVALIGGIIGIKSVSGGHHTSGAETKIVQKTTIQETTTVVQHETKAPVETKKKVDLIFPEKYKNVSAIKMCIRDRYHMSRKYRIWYRYEVCSA